MIEIMSNLFIDRFVQYGKRTLSLGVGERLFTRGDRARFMFILLSGEIELVRYQRDGKELILYRAVEGRVIAEASLYADHYHCDAVCTDPATVVSIQKDLFKKLLRESPDLAGQWSAYLAWELQNTRYRSELLNRRTVHDRLEGWLDWNGGKLPPRGKLKNLASEIGVTPEALYRELAKIK